MNFVESVQSNWRSLPENWRRGMATAAGAAGGLLQAALMEPGHIDWLHLLEHMGSFAAATLVFYLIPNRANLPGPQPPAPPTQKADKP